MTRIRRAGALAAAVISLALVLTGCFGQTPSPTPTADARPPAPTAAPTPTAEPADRLTTVVALVARPEALELLDGSGTVVASLDYLGTAAEAVAQLSTVLGEAPVTEPYEGGNHNPAGVRHTWDDAIEIDERFYPEERRAGLPSQLVWPRFAVSFLAPAIRGIDLTTATNVHVGDGFEALGEQIDPDLRTCEGWALEYVEVPRPDFPPLKIGVGVSEWGYDTATGNWGQQVDHVVTVSAPLTVAEACA